jgi:predicted enzyme related to lactoylglutathione lyase
MPRVVHFEISANDPEKLAAFYRDVFDWKITRWEGPQDYWLISTGDPGEPGIDGGFFRPTETFTATVNTIDVPDLDVYLKRIKQHGGQVVVDKHIIPGVGYLAYCKDIEGTLFGVHQEDRTAGL